MQTSRLRKQSQFKANSLMGIVAFLLLLSSEVCLSDSETRKYKYGELKIEGKYIERLVLLPNVGPAQTLDDPNETVRLPVGEYRVHEVRLKGGYRRETIANVEPVVISEDSPAMLKVGGPLKHTVSVVRQGRVLELSYRLLDVGGETYATATSGKPPTFAIYKSERQIATGKFEYG